MSPYARYSILRFLLFAVVLLVGYAVGMREFLLIVFALVVSAVLSYLLLGGPRRAGGAGVTRTTPPRTPTTTPTAAEPVSGAPRRTAQRSVASPRATASSSA